MASLVLLITLCFAFGLLCGCCGKRPVDRYDDDFGTRATGASCLMAYEEEKLHAHDIHVVFRENVVPKESIQQLFFFLFSVSK